MARLDHRTYLQHIRAESTRFRDVLAECDPGARVPSCPDWDAGDLLWHLGEVQHFWEHVVRTRPSDPAGSGYVEPSRPDGRAALLAFFDEVHGAFVSALDAADPAEPAWSWSSSPEHQAVSFTYRRQAHEALIHRRDAELTAGVVTPFDPGLAADGVEEILDVMYGGQPEWGRFDPRPAYVEVRLEDARESVWVQLGIFSGTGPDGTSYADEEDLRVQPDPGVTPSVVIAGSASDVDGWLWRRADQSGVTVTGDDAAYRHLRAVLDQPIT